MRAEHSFNFRVVSSWSKLIWPICYLWFCIALSGCNSYKKVLYFQDLDRSKITREDITNYSPLIIQTEDILSINVSSLNPEASAVFSFSSQSSSGGGASGGGDYLVDHDGQINLPLLGTLTVAGMTTAELREDVRKKLLIYLKEPIVNIRLMNFKVAVIGDISNPGVYDVENEKISIPELLSMAGDLTSSAKRNQVILIREQNGEREYIPVDLTKNVFKSPYFYLKNNDLIYVQPGRNRAGGVFQTFSVVASVFSVAAIAVQLFR